MVSRPLHLGGLRQQYCMLMQTPNLPKHHRHCPLNWPRLELHYLKRLVVLSSNQIINRLVMQG